MSIKNSRCKNCKYWKEQDLKCSNEKFVYGVDTPKDGLAYWDYESYSAGFNTGPDFGCIHWEKK